MAPMATDGGRLCRSQATQYGSWSGLTASIDEPINHQSPTPAAAAAAASGAAVERVGASDDVVVRYSGATLKHSRLYELSR
jgi:hypothetical protein